MKLTFHLGQNCWVGGGVGAWQVLKNLILIQFNLSLHEGENPRGFWQLKIIDNPLNEIGDRVLNGYGTLHLDTSKQDTDVEDLEEQVIDDQTKQQQARVQQMKLQVL